MRTCSAALRRRTKPLSPINCQRKHGDSVRCSIPLRLTASQVHGPGTEREGTEARTRYTPLASNLLKSTRPHTSTAAFTTRSMRDRGVARSLSAASEAPLCQVRPSRDVSREYSGRVSCPAGAMRSGGHGAQLRGRAVGRGSNLDCCKQNTRGVLCRPTVTRWSTSHLRFTPDTWQ